MLHLHCVTGVFRKRNYKPALFVQAIVGNWTNWIVSTVSIHLKWIVIWCSSDSTYGSFIRPLFSFSYLKLCNMCSSFDRVTLRDSTKMLSMKVIWRFFLLGPSHSSGPTAVCLVFSPCLSIADSPPSRLPSSSPATKKTLSPIKALKTPNLINHCIMDCAALSDSYDFGYCPRQNQVILQLFPIMFVTSLTSGQPLSQCVTICSRVYIDLYT